MPKGGSKALLLPKRNSSTHFNIVTWHKDGTWWWQSTTICVNQAQFTSPQLLGGKMSMKFFLENLRRRPKVNTEARMAWKHDTVNLENVWRWSTLNWKRRKHWMFGKEAPKNAFGTFFGTLHLVLSVWFRDAPWSCWINIILHCCIISCDLPPHRRNESESVSSLHKTRVFQRALCKRGSALNLLWLSGLIN